MKLPELLSDCLASSEPGYPSPLNATVLMIFAYRIGPIAIQGAQLMNRVNTSFQIYMPRCRSTGDHITVSDLDTRGANKTAAKRAYTRLIADSRHRMANDEETVVLLADVIFMRLAEFEPGEAYYRDVMCRVAASSPDVTVAELVEAILRVEARTDCFQDGLDTVQ